MGLRWRELWPPVQKGHREHQLSTQPPTHAVLNLALPPTQKHRSLYSSSQRRKEVQRGSAALPRAESKPRICTRAWVPTTAPVPPPPWALGSLRSDHTALVTWPEVIPNQGPRSLGFNFPICNKERTTQVPPLPRQCCGVRGGGGRRMAVQSPSEAPMRWCPRVPTC